VQPSLLQFAKTAVEAVADTG